MRTDTFTSAAGVTTEAKWDDDGVTIKRTQRVDPIIQDFREQSSDGPNRHAFGRLAARVPIEIYNRWQQEWKDSYREDVDLKTFMAMKINGPEGAPFRNQRIRG